MNNNLTLLIMAAGMGSRFGGLKQIEKMGPNGEFVIDYSIYDAIKYGFNKVVFVIKKENEQIFKETIGKRVEKHIKVEYAFQELNDIPEGFSIPEDRIKPLGTTQAIYAARHVINEPFAIINADDFYGEDAYKKASEFLKSNNDENSYCSIGYKVINTLSENGSVKRGVINTENEYLTSIIESSIEIEKGNIVVKPLSGAEQFTINEDKLVSMNLFGFKPSLFNYIKEDFPKFLEENKNNLDKCEYLIVDELTTLIENKKITIKVLNTNSNWLGVTYKEDTEKVKQKLNELINNNDYPNNLW